MCVCAVECSPAYNPFGRFGLFPALGSNQTGPSFQSSVSIRCLELSQRPMCLECPQNFRCTIEGLPRPNPYFSACCASEREENSSGEQWCILFFACHPTPRFKSTHTCTTFNEAARTGRRRTQGKKTATQPVKPTDDQHLRALTVPSSNRKHFYLSKPTHSLFQSYRTHKPLNINEHTSRKLAKGRTATRR